MNKIRIAMILNDFNLNGISMVVMNYCRFINKDKFEVTVITGAPADKSNLEECRNLGICVKVLPSRKKSSRAYYFALFKELSGKKYDIAHIHGNSATITPELLIAMLKGINIRVAHSHNSTCDHMKAHRILKPFFNMLYTHGFACSDIAGKWLFGNRKFCVIPNGFDTERFIYNSSVREKIRTELKINDKFVIGHIGRFNNQKNHPYLLKVFQRVAEQRDDAVLLLVGNGPDYDKIRNIIDNHKYKDRIIVYGETSSPEELYNAMDIFVFPSKYEGLGIVVLEAQINGLKCVVSDVVPDEVRLGERIEFLPLSAPKEWIKNISSTEKYQREEYYESHQKQISAFDMHNCIKKLENRYITFYRKVKD